MKLIKLSESHYIIVDDSEIKIGDYAIHNNKEYREKYNELPILCTESNCLSIQEHWNKVTHSTKKLEYHQVDPKLIDDGIEGWVFDKIKPLNINEIEELIYGYSVEKMAEKECIGNQAKRGFNKGFQAAMEINKDKLFTIEDMRKAINISFRRGNERKAFFDSDYDIIESLLPKNRMGS